MLPFFSVSHMKLNCYCKWVIFCKLYRVSLSTVDCGLCLHRVVYFTLLCSAGQQNCEHSNLSFCFIISRDWHGLDLITGPQWILSSAKFCKKGEVRGASTPKQIGKWSFPTFPFLKLYGSSRIVVLKTKTRDIQINWINLLNSESPFDRRDS